MNPRQEEIDAIYNMGRTLVDKANNLGSAFEKDLPKVRFGENTKKTIWEGLTQALGGKDYIDDEEFFEEVAREYVDAAIMAGLYQRKDVKDYLSYQEKYWGEVEKFTNSIVNDYKDVTPNNSERIRIAKNYVYDRLQTSFPAYLYRHFDDYWIYDTDAFQTASDRLLKDFTLDKWPN